MTDRSAEVITTTSCRITELQEAFTWNLTPIIALNMNDKQTREMMTSENTGSHGSDVAERMFGLNRPLDDKFHQRGWEMVTRL